MVSPMASLIFKRAKWCLEITRTSRNISVSFSTALPRHHRQHHHLRDATTATPSLRDSLVSRSSRRHHTSYSQSRSIASTARAYQASAVNDIERADTTPSPSPPSDLSSGFNDEPLILDEGSRQIDWSRSFHGLSTTPFPKEASDTLLQPIDPQDVEVKPDGIIYLPEIKYRRILNKAFGPGGWGLAPRGETIVTSKAVTREYALVALGRLVSVARGEQDYFSPEGIPTASEGCKSNALLRCCKDLGVASELWDPRFIRKFVAEHIKEVWVEHQVTKKRRKIFIRKEDKVGYPFKETKSTAGAF